MTGKTRGCTALNTEACGLPHEAYRHFEDTTLLLSATDGGHVHEKRMCDSTPYPVPAGSRLLQALGFLAFTLSQVELLMPPKTPRGQELTPEEQRANQALHDRRLRTAHVHSRVKRCRIVTDRIRLA